MGVLRFEPHSVAYTTSQVDKDKDKSSDHVCPADTELTRLMITMMES